MALIFSCHLNVYKLSSGTTMESASLKNRLKTFLLLAKTIHALNDLADESDFFVEWAVDGSLDMDDMARSFAILGAEDMPYIYYSLYSEREAHDTGSLTLYYGCERPDSDDSELTELGNPIKIGFAGECLNVSWDGSPYSGIEVSHSKTSLRNLHEDACMMVCLYLHNSTVDKYPAVYERHCPNECLEENGDPIGCVNIYLTLNEDETVKEAALRLLPEIDSSAIKYYKRCFDDGEIIQPIEELMEWNPSEL